MNPFFPAMNRGAIFRLSLRDKRRLRQPKPMTNLTKIARQSEKEDEL
ncbi:hypothetical protein KJ068_24355 [bacterium]|nr:hypothetical protein [bacterium]